MIRKIAAASAFLLILCLTTHTMAKDQAEPPIGSILALEGDGDLIK